MAGLVPAIHVLTPFEKKEVVDARPKAGHDGGEVVRSNLRSEVWTHSER